MKAISASVVLLLLSSSSHAQDGRFLAPSGKSISRSLSYEASSQLFVQSFTMMLIGGMCQSPEGMYKDALQNLTLQARDMVDFLRKVHGATEAQVNELGNKGKLVAGAAANGASCGPRDADTLNQSATFIGREMYR